MFASLEKSLDSNGSLVIRAGEKTNAFHDPVSDYSVFNCPVYYLEKEGDFILKAKISPEFRHLFDAGCLMAYEDDNKWIKCAFENTDNGYCAVVAVITNTVSDDTTGQEIHDNSIWMQLVRKGNNWAIHYSHDGQEWKMFRYFHLPMKSTIRIGVSVQSPKGDYCECKFESIEITKGSCENMRQGK
jgi:regulation of enolase protein 1 (concanavalin A-like superfamily)